MSAKNGVRPHFFLIAAFACSSALAQAPGPMPDGKDTPRKEQREKVRAAHKKAAGACKDTKGDAHRDCMQREMCAQAKDPAKCNERIAKMRDAHSKAEEICKSAQPDKHRDCMRHEMCAQAKDPVKCEAQAKQRAERRKAAKPSS
jgi:hypothetical protein